LGVSLRLYTPADLPWIFKIETDPRIIWRFRLGGKALASNNYEKTTLSGVLAQSVVVSNDDGADIGIVYADKYDPVNGTAEFGLVADPERSGTGLVLHGMLLFLDQLFEQFSLRKLVGESMEFNIDQFANGQDAEDFSELFGIEAVYPDYYYLNGRHWARIQIAIFREDWISHRPKMIRSAKARVDRLRSADSKLVPSSLPGNPIERVVAKNGSDSTGPNQGISLDSDRYSLRAISDSDLPWCTELISNAARSFSLRFNAASLGTREMDAQLWSGVLCHFVIWDRSTSLPVGLICAYDVAGAHMVASAHLLLANGALGSDVADAADVAHEAVGLFLDYIFTLWPLRKVYFRYAEMAPELDLCKQVLSSGSVPYWNAIGVLRRQLNIGGLFIDQIVIELTRAAWEELRAADNLIGPGAVV